MNQCIYCSEMFAERKVGDHVIPQSLGVFHPEFLLKNVCQTCDNKNGDGIERSLAREGSVGWFRLLHAIKSKNNKGDPLFNPLTDRRSGYQSNSFDVYRVDEKTGDKIRPYALPNGKLYSPLSIEIVNADGSIKETRYIEPTLGSKEIAELCFAVSKESKPLTVRYNVPEEMTKEVQQIIVSLGGKILSEAVAEKGVANPNFDVHISIDESFLRGALNVALKAMVYSGYDPKLLTKGLRFARYGEFPEGGVSTVNKKASQPDLTIDTDISNHGHRFDWFIDHKNVLVNAFILCSMKTTGLVFQFRFPLCPSGSIVIPSGSLIAKYTNKKPGSSEIGWAELIVGGEVRESARPSE